jgi:peptidyl-prolyl cis-trans isomerase A (cyclophilin A)
MTAFFLAASRRAVLAALAGTLAAGAWAADAPKVKFVTTLGEFVVEVDPEKSPKTVENFCST